MTAPQEAKGIKDSLELFKVDTTKSGDGLSIPALVPIRSPPWPHPILIFKIEDC